MFLLIANYIAMRLGLLGMLVPLHGKSYRHLWKINGVRDDNCHVVNERIAHHLEEADEPLCWCPGTIWSLSLLL
jgi:hypothetical protein